MGPQIKMGTPMTMAIVQIKMEDLVEIETLQIGEEEGLLEKNENPDGGDRGSDLDDSGDGDDSSSSTDSTPRRRGHRKPKYVYVLTGPPGPPGQEGQPGQVGRDGRHGQALPLVRALEETLRAQRTNLDTTSLQNSFSQFGRTMSDVLKAQQRTNQNLEELFRRANETQEFKQRLCKTWPRQTFR